MNTIITDSLETEEKPRIPILVEEYPTMLTAAIEILQPYMEGEIVTTPHGSYDVLQQIGRGNTAMVYQAKDRDSGKLVAIKLYAPSQKHPILTQDNGEKLLFDQFVSEQETISRLRLKGYVKFLDNGFLSDGAYAIPYTVMEFINGFDMSEFGDVSEMPFKDLLQSVESIVAMISSLHKAGFLHRDIKPSGFMYDPEKDETYSADNGAAIKKDEKPITLPFSPNYAAPEICPYGINTPLDTVYIANPFSIQSDVYALGITMTELLYGLNSREIDKIVNPVRGIDNSYNREGHVKMQESIRALQLKDKGMPLVYPSKILADIICQATALKPEMRFRNTLDILDELKYFENNTVYKILDVETQLYSDNGFNELNLNRFFTTVNTVIDQSPPGLIEQALEDTCNITYRVLANQINKTQKDSLNANMDPYQIEETFQFFEKLFSKVDSNEIFLSYFGNNHEVLNMFAVLYRKVPAKCLSESTHLKMQKRISQINAFLETMDFDDRYSKSSLLFTIA